MPVRYACFDIDNLITRLQPNLLTYLISLKSLLLSLLLNLCVNFFLDLLLLLLQLPQVLSLLQVEHLKYRVILKYW